jgi:hypothetical protein
MEQRGTVYSYSSTFGNKKLFLNLTSSVKYNESIVDEGGLLSMVLHPRFSENGKIYTYSIRKFKGDYVAYVTELKEISGEVDISREQILLVIKQPGERNNGGQVRLQQLCNVLQSWVSIHKTSCD